MNLQATAFMLHRVGIVALLAGLLFVPAVAPAQTSPATLPDLKLAASGTVTAMAVQNDGKILIAGSFQSVNDVPRAGLARLNSDGSLDLAWNPSVTTSPNQPLNVILESGTNIYIGGGGFSVNNIQGDQRSIARLSIVDGSTDQAWNPGVVGGVVFTIAISNTNIYVGGNFTGVGNVSRVGLARLNLDGAADIAWNPTLTGQSVRQMVLDGTNLFVAGGFTAIGGQTRSKLAKLSVDTGLADPNWNPNPQGGSFSRWALALTGTNLFLAGDFSVIGNTNRNGLAKLSTEGNGDVDPTWDPFGNLGSIPVLTLVVWNGTPFLGGQNGSLPFLAKVGVDNNGNATLVNNAWGANANVTDAANQNGSVNALIATPGGIIVGGAFAHLGVTGSGGTPSLGIGKLDAVTGQRDESFRGQIQIPGSTYAIARQADGRIIVGGSFQSAGGLARANLVRVSTSGEVDPTWSPNTDGPVYALALNGSDLFVGGAFTKAGGLTRTNLAKIATMGIDSAIASWDAQIATGYAPVRALIASGTNLFVGGGDSYGWGSIGGQSRNSFAKLSTANPCLADANWIVDAPAGGVNTLALDNTNLFVGGGFPNIGGANRTGLAKVSTLGAGLVDANWSPAISNFTASVYALALSETNLFVGGNFKPSNGHGRNKLAKLSTSGTGQLDTLWIPDVAASDGDGVRALAVSGGTNLYAAGTFSAANGLVANVARISALDTGAVDTVFAPNPSGQCNALLVSGNDVYVGGSFGNFWNVLKGGFAFQPVADAPVMIQDSATNFFVFRNPFDGPEVTHFRVVSLGVNSPPLYLSDMTPVHGGDFITVTQGTAGLVFSQPGVVTLASAVSPTSAGVGSATSTLVMDATAAPVFRFSSQNYSTREGQGNIVLTVRKFGTGPAAVSYATTDQTATGGVDYQSKSGTLNFSSTDRFKNIVLAIADDLQTEGDEQFEVRLFASANQIQTETLDSANVTIVDNDITGADSFLTNAPPTLRPTSTGVLNVTLLPASATGQWRLFGELHWHNSGESIAGLTTNNYEIEFRPIAGYTEPQTNALTILAGVTNTFSFTYRTNTSSATGRLTVRIEPPDVATNLINSSRGQWRLAGVTNWLDSDVVASNLPAGIYSIEFKLADGRFTPAPRNVSIIELATARVTATYLVGNSAGTTNVFVVPPEMAATNKPHCYNGQIQTSSGFGSGFVVKPRVVLTAGHVLFDDVSLANVTETRWFFQRYRDQFEPVPQTPRGWYLFGGYAAQRQLDNSPGISSPASQQLDAAAMYFLEPAGRGGFGGYLSSDADDNEYLLNAADKFLVGYPLDGVTETNQGKLHATAATNLTFVHLYNSVFKTTDIQSYPGNSGGPLYVQTDANTFYPAAIYLGGSGEALVRAINGEVVDLINRAEISSNGGGNSTGGGVTIIRIGVTAQSAGYATITVSLTPTIATNIRPGWRLHSAAPGPFFTEPVKSLSVYAHATYVLEFQPVPGFIKPNDFSLAAMEQNQEVVLEVEYLPIPPTIGFTISNGLTLTGAVDAMYRIESATNLSPPVFWTSVTNVTLTTSFITISNTRPTTIGNRFYRAALLP